MGLDENALLPNFWVACATGSQLALNNSPSTPSESCPNMLKPLPIGNYRKCFCKYPSISAAIRFITIRLLANMKRSANGLFTSNQNKSTSVTRTLEML